MGEGMLIYQFGIWHSAFGIDLIGHVPLTTKG